MVGWHHRLSGHEFEQTLGDSEGQGSLVCCSPWGHKLVDLNEQLNNSLSYSLESVDGELGPLRCFLILGNTVFFFGYATWLVGS